MGIKHTFVSAVADGADATLVRPSNWNDDHTIDSDVDFNGFDLLLDDNTGILSSEAGNPSLLLFESVASAVNYLKLTNSATGNPVLLDGTCSDVDVGVDLRAKGDGNLRFYQDAGTTLQATIGDGLILGTGTTEPGAGNLAFADLKGIFDGAANEQLLFDQVASAVNYLQISNSATGNAPVLAATGSDANVGLILRNRKGSANNDALTINDERLAGQHGDSETPIPRFCCKLMRRMPGAEPSAWSISSTSTICGAG